MRVAVDARVLGNGDSVPSHGIARATDLTLGALADGAGWDRVLEVVLLGAPGGVAERRARTSAGGRLPLDFAPCAAPLYGLREQWALERAARRAGADLLHVPHHGAPGRGSMPMTMTAYDLTHLRHPAPGRGPLHAAYYRAVFRRAVRRARAVATISAVTGRDLVRHMGADPGLLHVVPVPVAPEFPAVERRPGDPGAGADLGVRAPYLLSTVNPRVHKNAAGLVAIQRALERLVDDAPMLVVVGDAGRRARAAAAGTGTVFTGPVADAVLLDLLAGARAFVCASLWEGFGLPPLEAAAAGVPVVSSPRGALREVLGPAAVYGDPSDPPAFARVLAAPLDDPDRMADLSAAGRARAAAFTPQSAAVALARLWRTAAA